MEKNKRVRQRLVVNLGFQLKYTLLVLILSSGIFAGLGIQLYKKELEKTRILGIQNPEILEIIQSADQKTVYYLAAAFAAQVIITVLVGLFLTHKMIGPITRAKNSIDTALESGEFRPVLPIRKGDEFGSFFHSVNQLLEKHYKK
ncbi:MAG: hypothetical protein R3A11_01590 [Bdellovibrionota bacterium]